VINEKLSKMTKKTEQTASFMVRFNQQIFEESGESKIQWRGKVSHVQSGNEKRFVDFKDAVSFMQENLENLTKEATKHQSKETQESLLKKGFSMFKTATHFGTEMLKETIKDPKKQIGQIQEQISFIGEEISERVQEKVHLVDDWRNASRNDFKKVQDSIGALGKEIKKLNAKMDALSKE